MENREKKTIKTNNIAFSSSERHEGRKKEGGRKLIPGFHLVKILKTKHIEEC